MITKGEAIVKYLDTMRTYWGDSPPEEHLSFMITLINRYARPCFKRRGGALYHPCKEGIISPPNGAYNSMSVNNIPYCQYSYICQYWEENGDNE